MTSLRPCTSAAVMAWYTASPDTHLPRGPFRLALGQPPRTSCVRAATEVCLPPIGYRTSLLRSFRTVWMPCPYLRLWPDDSDGTTPYATLGQDVLKAARWRCETEQVVRTGEGTFHRADLVATAPDGTSMGA